MILTGALPVGSPSGGSDVAAWITAIATVLLVVGVGMAYRQLLESQSDRHSQVMFELGRRWDSAEMIETRAKVDACRDAAGLRLKIEALYEDKGEEYWQLVREPGFFEDMAILRKERTVDPKVIDESMILLVQERWLLWEGATQFLASKRQSEQVFKNFKDWAIEAAATNEADAAGHARDADPR